MDRVRTRGSRPTAGRWLRPERTTSSTTGGAPTSGWWGRTEAAQAPHSHEPAIGPALVADGLSVCSSRAARAPPGLAHPVAGRGRAGDAAGARRQRVPGLARGTRLLVALDVFPGAGMRRRRTPEAREETEKTGPSGRIYEKLLVRHWDAWSDGRRSHLFVVPCGGEPVDLMRRWTLTAPASPSRGRGVTLSPTGGPSCSRRRRRARGGVVHEFRPLRRAPGRHRGPASSPREPGVGHAARVLTDGGTLAYLAMKIPASRPTASASCSSPGPTARPRAHRAWTVRLGIAWAPDGKTLYAWPRPRADRALRGGRASGAARIVVGKGPWKRRCRRVSGSSMR